MTTSRAEAPPAGTSARLRSGRVNARTISASAAIRTINSSQFWILRRRTGWYGIRRTNISDGKRMICFFSRCVRCSNTGMASPARAAKNRGARKLISIQRLPYPHHLGPAAEISVERVVQRLRRIEHGVVHAHAGEALRQRVDVRPHEGPILLAERFRHDGHLLAA